MYLKLTLHEQNVFKRSYFYKKTINKYITHIKISTIKHVHHLSEGSYSGSLELLTLSTVHLQKIDASKE